MATGYLDNFYARLGIPFTASQKEIRSAYYAAARKFHPDLNEKGHSTEIFLQIQEAYETLSNPRKRTEYDALLPGDLHSPENILVNTVYSRPCLTHHNQRQLLYVLLNIMTSPHAVPEEAGRQPVNLCLVVDSSNSMSGGRLDAVKDTANRILRLLKPEDILSVVTFNDEGEVIIPATRDQKPAMLEARISLIRAEGGTEIFQGLQAGYEQVQKNLGRSLQSHIVLITDGRTYGDEAQCLDLASQAAKQGVTIHALGIGSEWNDAFLEELTTRTGGSTEFAQTNGAVKRFMETKFGQIADNYATNVRLNYQPEEGMELSYIFRLSPNTSVIPVSENLVLGDVPKDRPLSVIMEFMVENTREFEAEVILLDGTLSMVMPSEAIPHFNSRITFSRPLEENPITTPPPRMLVDALSRLSLYRMQEMARKDLEAGRIDKATSRLRNLATQLLTAGQGDLAQTVMLELEEIEASSSMRPDGFKRIKFGTRALILENDEGLIE